VSGDRVVAAPVASVEARPNAAAPESKKDIRLAPVVWVTGLAAIVGAMLYFFTGRRAAR
jgi:membrane protein DedA with SNARE-associated domain